MDTSGSTPADNPKTSPHPDCPVQERQVLKCFEPEGYGPYGRQKEAVRDAYEDFVNGAFYAVDMTSDLAELSRFTSDDAHLTNVITSTSPELPDSPSLREALVRVI